VLILPARVLIYLAVLAKGMITGVSRAAVPCCRVVSVLRPARAPHTRAVWRRTESSQKPPWNNSMVDITKSRAATNRIPLFGLFLAWLHKAK
jgi:hypothetical protein